jgi:hypothetical protein
VSSAKSAWTSGYLLKKGGTRFQTKWQKRFFVLTDSGLTYYAEEGEVKVDGAVNSGGAVRGSVNFEGTCTVAADAKLHKDGLGFKVTVGGTGGRTLELVAADEAELADWVAKIQQKMALQEDNLTGFLSKRANSVPWNWKRRFFVLSPSNLSYTKKKGTGAGDDDEGGKGGGVRGVLMLTADARVNESPTLSADRSAGDHQFAFSLTTGTWCA